MPNPKIILDLCGGTGSWSWPYREAGYDVWLVTLPHYDVCAFEPPAGVHGVLAAPPCTEFAVSGARWWSSKPAWMLDSAVEITERCIEIIERASPRWWALENPVGRIARCVPQLGEPKLKFDPCDYGDPWTKKTCLWGSFVEPRKARVKPSLNVGGSSPIHRMSPGPDRQKLRSMTPPGFARAFFEANP